MHLFEFEVVLCISSLTSLLYIALHQRPNLPHPPFGERPWPPYLDKRVPPCPHNERPRLPYPASENFNRARPPNLDERWHASADNRTPRLPHPALTERPRVPLMELDEKSWLSHNEKADPTPGAEQPMRETSPLDEEDVDDYRILLQRHRLIQQQLAALEKQESSTLGEDNIIDDSFIDIPVEDTLPNLSLVGERNLEGIGHSLAQTRNEGFLNTQQFNVDRSVTSIATGNEIYNLESAGNLLEGESSGEGMTQKPFLPFKIKHLYNSVPSIKELSQKDLEQRGAKKYIETAEDDVSENLPAKKGSQTQSEGQRRGKLSRARKNRRKRKRKASQGSTQTNSMTNNEAMGNASIEQGGHVDAHNELEARLLSLAGSFVSDLGATDANR